jgi:CheY-like chemotaxis protein
MIVDDMEGNRVLLAAQLKRHGFETTIAAGGKEAIRQVESELPDLVLMDMNMPELDGWEATRQLRAQGNTIPIVALTAHAWEGDRERAIEAGCSDYHTKPVNVEILLKLIEQLLHHADECKTTE